MPSRRLLTLLPQGRCVVLFAATAGLACGSCAAQGVRPAAPISPSSANHPSPGGLFDDPAADSLRLGTATKMEHLREEDRRKHLLADTARLQALTGELQAELQKEPQEPLSPEAARKIAEIEKLARDVRERMKN